MQQIKTQNKPLQTTKLIWIIQKYKTNISSFYEYILLLSTEINIVCDRPDTILFILISSSLKN